MRLLQNGEDEGSLTFDPTNAAQSRLAIRIAGAKAKRQVSEVQRMALVARLQRGKAA